MTIRLPAAAAMLAGLAALSACGGSLAPDPAAIPNPPACNGAAQLANTPCPTIVDPYARNATTGGGRFE